MSDFRNRVVPVVGLAILAATFLLTNPNPGRSAPQPSSQNVLVTNTAASAVPTVAQGTTAISGNVGITGTPVVGLASGATVGVTSSAINPVFVRNVDPEAVREQFHGEGQVVLAPGELSNSMMIFAVPAGKRAVLEHVSATGRDDTGYRLRYGVITAVDVNGMSQLIQHYLLTEKQNDAQVPAIWNASQPLRATGDPGTLVGFAVERDQLNGLTAQVEVTVAGYLVNVP